jgi:hypothetical protein
MGRFKHSLLPRLKLALLEHYPTKLDRQNRDSQRETDERVCFQA